MANLHENGFILKGWLWRFLSGTNDGLPIQKEQKKKTLKMIINIAAKILEQKLSFSNRRKHQFSPHFTSFLFSFPLPTQPSKWSNFGGFLRWITPTPWLSVTITWKEEGRAWPYGTTQISLKKWKLMKGVERQAGLLGGLSEQLGRLTESVAPSSSMPHGQRSVRC